MMTTTFEKGMAKGVEEGQRRAARFLLEHRFGSLSDSAVQRLQVWPAEQLQELLVAVMEAPSLKTLGLED